jgi:putative SOS response-associated peptidase YedK
MCGRYGFTASPDEVSERFDIETVSFEINSNYNVAPTQEMPVVEKHSPNSLHLRRWGIQPGWSKIFLINAQAEKLASSGLWKKAFLENRVIIPANYFFEWKRTTDGKEPFLIRLKSKDLMGFAGLNVKYHDKEGKEKEGYVIITTKPNSLMEKIHNRMPVILRKEDESEWLNPDNNEIDRLEKMLDPFPSNEMEDYKISSLVNSPKNNFPEITKPLK